jgi:hypothetical protein
MRQSAEQATAVGHVGNSGSGWVGCPEQIECQGLRTVHIGPLAPMGMRPGATYRATSRISTGRDGEYLRTEPNHADQSGANVSSNYLTKWQSNSPVQDTATGVAGAAGAWGAADKSHFKCRGKIVKGAVATGAEFPPRNIPRKTRSNVQCSGRAGVEPRHVGGATANRSTLRECRDDKTANGGSQGGWGRDGEMARFGRGERGVEGAVGKAGGSLAADGGIDHEPSLAGRAAHRDSANNPRSTLKLSIPSNDLSEANFDATRAQASTALGALRQRSTKDLHDTQPFREATTDPEHTHSNATGARSVGCDVNDLIDAEDAAAPPADKPTQIHTVIDLTRAESFDSQAAGGLKDQRPQFLVRTPGLSALIAAKLQFFILALIVGRSCWNLCWPKATGNMLPKARGLTFPRTSGAAICSSIARATALFYLVTHLPVAEAAFSHRFWTLASTLKSNERSTQPDTREWQFKCPAPNTR